MDAPTAALEPNDATRSPRELFRYSTWLHVGAGAQECESTTTGACRDADHFHAWCRLPNQIQQQDIRERALAAKARRIRQLRDPEADAYLILEADLDELRRVPESMIEEIVSKDWWKRHLDVVGELEQDDEFEHIERDRERRRELEALPESERPSDEWGELERHFDRYGERLEQRTRELEVPLRDATEAMDEDELVDQVRENRITAEGSAAFMDTYAKWTWLAGTYVREEIIPPATERRHRFDAIAELEDQAPEVIESLQRTFQELETSLQRGPRGN